MPWKGLAPLGNISLGASGLWTTKGWCIGGRQSRLKIRRTVSSGSILVVPLVHRVSTLIRRLMTHPNSMPLMNLMMMRSMEKMETSRMTRAAVLLPRRGKHGTASIGSLGGRRMNEGGRGRCHCLSMDSVLCIMNFGDDSL